MWFKSEIEPRLGRAIFIVKFRILIFKSTLEFGLRIRLSQQLRDRIRVRVRDRDYFQSGFTRCSEKTYESFSRCRKTIHNHIIKTLHNPIIIGGCAGNVSDVMSRIPRVMLRILRGMYRHDIDTR